METRHPRTPWVGRGMGIAILVNNLAAFINIANRCAHSPRDPLLVISEKNLKCTRRYTDQEGNISIACNSREVGISTTNVSQ